MRAFLQVVSRLAAGAVRWGAGGGRTVADAVGSPPAGSAIAAPGSGSPAAGDGTRDGVDRCAAAGWRCRAAGYGCASVLGECAVVVGSFPAGAEPLTAQSDASRSQSILEGPRAMAENYAG
jgi:hypothetical protein